MKKLIIGILLLAVAGCASWTTSPSVCDNPPTISYLCGAANKYDIRLEWVGQGIVAINSANIGIAELYTAEQALDVMQHIRGVLDEPISYTFLVLEVEKYIMAYPGMLEVAQDIMHELDKLLLNVVAYDRYLIVTWLDQQISDLESMK